MHRLTEPDDNGFNVFTFIYKVYINIYTVPIKYAQFVAQQRIGKA